MEGFSGPDRTNLALDDAEELAPIDPVQKSLGAAPLLLIQRGMDLLPPECLMKNERG